LREPLHIAGGGIAGLTLALSFAQKNVTTIVSEKHAQSEESGYGLQLSPNALFALEKINIKPNGFQPEGLCVWSNGLKTTMPMAGFITLSRYGLLQNLLKAAKNHPLITLRYDENATRCDFDASGVHSPFRQDKPKQSGYIAYRRLEEGTLETVELHLSAQQYRVAYQISDNLINVVYAGKPPEGDYKAYRVQTRRLRFQTGSIYHIGDAAHAMLPNLGQGASMAIEDAVLLPDYYLNNKMQQYISLRTPRVQRVMRSAYVNSLIYQLPPPLSYARDFVMQRLDLRHTYAWLYDYKLRA
jgi:salicylate hydroxylase